MPTTERIQQLVAYVERGALPEAIAEFYADDVEMRENLNPPTVGRAANVERERNFVAYIAELHESRAITVLVDGDRAVIHWVLDFTGTDGKHFRYDQLAYQQWEGDRIVRERFVYDPGTVAVAA